MEKNFMLQGATKLNKKEMKSVRGLGYGTCAFITKSGFVMTGVDKAMAIEFSSGGGRWCCDSCGNATWLK